MRDAKTGQFQRTHGHTAADIGRATPEYRSWNAMRMRCKNPKRVCYAARGITVCSEWDSFEQFLLDMGPRPEGTTLDRKRTDEGYSKGNCRWATRREQQQNVRSNRNITYQGETHCLTEWARILGYDVARLYQRLKRGWDIARTLGTPTRRVTW